MSACAPFVRNRARPDVRGNSYSAPMRGWSTRLHGATSAHSGERSARAGCGSSALPLRQVRLPLLLPEVLRVLGDMRGQTLHRSSRPAARTSCRTYRPTGRCHESAAPHSAQGAPPASHPAAPVAPRCAPSARPDHRASWQPWPGFPLSIDRDAVWVSRTASALQMSDILAVQSAPGHSLFQPTMKGGASDILP